MARDARRSQTCATSVVVSEPKLGIVTADVDGNVCVFHYDPARGDHLLRRCDFHLGAMVTRMVSVGVAGCARDTKIVWRLACLTRAPLLPGAIYNEPNRGCVAQACCYTVGYVMRMYLAFKPKQP